MNAPFPPAEARRALIERHADLIEAAIKAVSARAAWSPFKDSPSTKIHGPDKPVAGKAAFEAQLNSPFDLDLPGVIDRVGGVGSLIVAVQTLANGRTTVLQGVIHLMLFAIYLFTTFVP